MTDEYRKKTDRSGPIYHDSHQTGTKGLPASSWTAFHQGERPSAFLPQAK
jgi:hypothetical protein